MALIKIEVPEKGDYITGEYLAALGHAIKQLQFLIPRTYQGPLQFFSHSQTLVFNSNALLSSMVLWGVVVTDWDSSSSSEEGNSVELYRCSDETGANPQDNSGVSTVTAYILSPITRGVTGLTVHLYAGDVVAYLPFGTNKGVIINADIRELPSGSEGDVLTMQSGLWRAESPAECGDSGV